MSEEIKINWFVIVIVIILFLTMIVLQVFTSKNQHEQFCEAFGYEETLGWSYVEETKWNLNPEKANYVDCCSGVDCERIWLEDLE